MASDHPGSLLQTLGLPIHGQHDFVQPVPGVLGVDGITKIKTGQPIQPASLAL